MELASAPKDGNFVIYSRLSGNGLPEHTTVVRGHLDASEFMAHYWNILTHVPMFYANMFGRARNLGCVCNVTYSNVV